MHNPLPDSVKQQIQSAQWQIVGEGESDARVYRLIDTQTRYLKISQQTAQYTVKAEYERLNWLSGKVPVPDILHYTEDENYQFLLMSNCPGLHPLHDDLAWTVEARIDALVQSAQALHGLSTENCPYRMSFDEQIALAQHNIEQEHVDAENQGRNINDLFAEFVALKPEKEDYVITHGDLYPVNIRVDVDTQGITGFIDVGAMAVADRYTDFAPIVNAIGWHHDEKWIDRFFDAYGIPLDRDKLRFYQLFQEFL